MGCFSYIKLLFVAFITTSSTFGVLLEKPQDLSKADYDFIIVGGMYQTPYIETVHSGMLPGGTAGAVIANRLTENPNVSVLVLEAGNAYVDIDEINLSLTQSLPFPQKHWH